MHRGPFARHRPGSRSTLAPSRLKTEGARKRLGVVGAVSWRRDGERNDAEVTTPLQFLVVQLGHSQGDRDEPVVALGLLLPGLGDLGPDNLWHAHLAQTAEWGGRIRHDDHVVPAALLAVRRSSRDRVIRRAHEAFPPTREAVYNSSRPACEFAGGRA